MEKEIDRFTAEAENGQVFTVIMYQEFKKVRSMVGTEILPGLKNIELADGSPVNWIDDDTFKIVMTDQIIKKIK